jgi:hypothetical protein
MEKCPQMTSGYQIFNGHMVERGNYFWWSKKTLAQGK